MLAGYRLHSPRGRASYEIRSGGVWSFNLREPIALAARLLVGRPVVCIHGGAFLQLSAYRHYSCPHPEAIEYPVERLQGGFGDLISQQRRVGRRRKGWLWKLGFGVGFDLISKSFAQRAGLPNYYGTVNQVMR